MRSKESLKEEIFIVNKRIHYLMVKRSKLKKELKDGEITLGVEAV